MTPFSIVEQRESESAWRQLLIQGVLAVLLPTEDLENGCLRALVVEILAEMIVANGIGGKACEGWLLWEGITRIVEVLEHPEAKDTESPRQHSDQEQSLSRLERYGLLAPPVEGENGQAERLLDGAGRHKAAPMTSSGLFWAVVQFAFLVGTAMRAVIVAIATSSSLPMRSATEMGGPPTAEADRQSPLPGADDSAGKRALTSKRPIVSMKLWSCASNLVELETRMPWLSGLISMLQWTLLVGPGRVGNTDGALDR